MADPQTQSGLGVDDLRKKLEQQAALISALLKTHALLTSQAQEEQLLLASLAHQLDYNVQASKARPTAKRKHSGSGDGLAEKPCLLENAVYRSAEDVGGATGDADEPRDCLSLPDHLAVLDSFATALQRIMHADVTERLRELERLRDQSLALI